VAKRKTTRKPRQGLRYKWPAKMSKTFIGHLVADLQEAHRGAEALSVLLNSGALRLPMVAVTKEDHTAVLQHNVAVEYLAYAVIADIRKAQHRMNFTAAELFKGGAQ
jgi:hypothetical protein